MAFVALGFKTLTHTGSIDGTAGSMNAHHSYVTNDDLAAIETANYFDSIWKRLRKGDVIFCSLNLDGTPVYIIKGITSSASTGVVIQDIVIT